jgi:hypothetical protein
MTNHYSIFNDKSKKRLIDIWTHLYTALILIVALAWNEAIKSIFELYPKFKAYGSFIYAIIVTIIVFFIIDIVDFLGKAENIHK